MGQPSEGRRHLQLGQFSRSTFENRELIRGLRNLFTRCCRDIENAALHAAAPRLHMDLHGGHEAVLAANRGLSHVLCTTAMDLAK
jgi:hypothetical protein